MRRRTALGGVALAGMTAASLALSGCDNPRPPACPGDRIATFKFRGELLAEDGASCPFVSDAGLSFTATVSFTGETEGALCLDRSEARPLAGARTGDHLTLSAPTVAAAAPTCSCSVDVTETLEGDLVRVDGAVVGFTGVLRDVLTVADAGDPARCEPAAGPADAGVRCGVPCQVRWQLGTAR